MHKDFPILNVERNSKRIIYLDSGSTSQKPQVVIDAITKFYKESNANIHRGIYRLSEKATIMHQIAREKVAKFINAEVNEIIFTSGTTQSINLLAYSFNLQPGDEIIISEMEHHSNLIPWQQLSKRTGAILKYIPVKDYKLDMENIPITEKTKIISVTHMSNVLGTINPIKELAKLAHQVNAILIVDAAQSVPHMPVDVKELDCDFLAFSGHKMCGPTGIGVLFGKKELLEKMDPLIQGGGMVKKVTKHSATWADTPYKFEAGTPNIAGAIGLAAAIDYLSNIGMENVWKQGQELKEYALQKLQIPGLKIIGSKQSPVISFTLEGIHPHDIAEILNKQNIAVRGGHHCCMPLMEILNLTGTTRISFYIYNTKEDVDKLVVALSKTIEVFA